MSNIIETKTGTIIFNGGDPLGDCPNSYADADKWATDRNSGRGELDYPMWSFDCGFKLDFDGPLITISSRFYPPKTHYGATWDGSVTIYIGGHEVLNKEFDCKSLDELHKSVEEYVSLLKYKLIDFIKNLPE